MVKAQFKFEKNVEKLKKFKTKKDFFVISGFCFYEKKYKHFHNKKKIKIKKKL